MQFRNYKYLETNEDGEVLSKEPCTITLKADVDVAEVEKKLGVKLTPVGDVFEYNTDETEFRLLSKGKLDKFTGYVPTFRSFIK